MHVLTIIADYNTIIQGVYSTAEKARQALVDYVANSPIDPTGTEVYPGDECPQDWHLEPTAFDCATQVLANETDYKWKFAELEVDADADGVD